MREPQRPVNPYYLITLLQREYIPGRETATHSQLLPSVISLTEESLPPLLGCSQGWCVLQARESVWRSSGVYWNKFDPKKKKKSFQYPKFIIPRPILILFGVLSRVYFYICKVRCRTNVFLSSSFKSQEIYKGFGCFQRYLWATGNPAHADVFSGSALCTTLTFQMKLFQSP